MEFGDISNTLAHTTGWDFRLFIDVKYPKIFEFCMKKKYFGIAKLTFKWNQQMVDAYNMSASNGKVITTHIGLKTLFEKNGFETIHLSNYSNISTLKVDEIFTEDVIWVATCAKCQLVPKPPKVIHSKKMVDKVLSVIDWYLSKR